MHRLLSRALVTVAAAVLLVGCKPHATFYSADPTALGQDGNSNLLRVKSGRTVVAHVKIVREEIEGSSEFEVDEVTSDDPAIVTIEALGDSQFSLRGIAEGETKLRVKIAGDERDVVPIRVLP
jgi:hypothetical protein